MFFLSGRGQTLLNMSGKASKWWFGGEAKKVIIVSGMGTRGSEQGESEVGEPGQLERRN